MIDINSFLGKRYTDAVADSFMYQNYTLRLVMEENKWLEYDKTAPIKPNSYDVSVTNGVIVGVRNSTNE